MPVLLVKLRFKDSTFISRAMQVPTEPKRPGERLFGPAERYVRDDIVDTLRDKAETGGWDLAGSTIEYEIKPDLIRR